MQKTRSKIHRSTISLLGCRLRCAFRRYDKHTKSVPKTEKKRQQQTDTALTSQLTSHAGYHFVVPLVVPFPVMPVMHWQNPSGGFGLDVGQKCSGLDVTALACKTSALQSVKGTSTAPAGMNCVRAKPDIPN